MEIVNIFAPPNNHLYAVKYKNKNADEFVLAFRQWQNPEWLEDFFENNKEDLQNGFYEIESIEEAIEITIECSSEFENKIIEAIDESKHTKESTLNDFIFKPLDNYETKLFLQSNKAKRKWLRLYAIRLSKGAFIITGSAIKLTKQMKEREHTRVELENIEKVKSFLI